MIKNVQSVNGYVEIVRADSQRIANLGIFLCNSNSKNADVVDLYIIPDGESPSHKNKILSELYIPPSQTFSFGEEKFILEPGDSIGFEAQVGGRVSATVTFTDL